MARGRTQEGTCSPCCSTSLRVLLYVRDSAVRSRRNSSCRPSIEHNLTPSLCSRRCTCSLRGWCSLSWLSSRTVGTTCTPDRRSRPCRTLSGTDANPSAPSRSGTLRRLTSEARRHSRVLSPRASHPSTRPS
eukprot:422012-Rhodomonas_salina.4